MKIDVINMDYFANKNRGLETLHSYVQSMVKIFTELKKGT